MITTSKELIDKAREALNSIMSVAIEKGIQPSFMEMFYRGYINGFGDAKEGKEVIVKSEKDVWHFIELEGNPPDDDRCIVMFLYDKYYDTTEGWFENGKWNLEWKPSSFEKVVAWHALPQIPDELWKD